ncbi:aminoglycoside phosphotransferase family protein [Aspergillus homomorphus CBS 101889]|uniref:Phosphotransferase family protein n=1 Tax=Aspergillus homomorphus (strain CBS 101889) TaxID=1450537 RepID=A0A395I487_ASPHC|nr:phosphotransferase family protein [Aspergillus homomorphus CBS 101889]RAL14787.1 phosphotransferase family protein [Aspergillus homomorphus CBS 101889]
MMIHDFRLMHRLVSYNIKYGLSCRIYPTRNLTQLPVRCHRLCSSRSPSSSLLAPSRPFHSIRTLSSAKNVSESDDLFRYTSGRWLWNEEQRLQDRFVAFNVSELQTVAANSIGANKCVSITKLAEGGSNRAFLLKMDDGRSVIAKLPYPIAGPKYYTTASEVATMDFARTVLGIQAPKVFAWSADSHCAVGAEYIIMEVAPGTQVLEVWDDDFDPKQKLSITRGLVELHKKMCSMSLNCYGSLYYAAENIPGAVPVELAGDIPAEVKEEAARRFVVGPVAESNYWTGERAHMTLDRGPWTRPQDYIASLAHREKAWIQLYAVPRGDNDEPDTAGQNSPACHIELIDKYLQVAPILLPEDPTIVAPYLFHNDLHNGNIFVEDGKITSVIDWQGLWAAPRWLHGRPPKLIRYQGEMILRLPENFQELDAEEKKKVRRTISKSVVQYVYQTEVEKEIPVLYEVFVTDYGRLRCNPVFFVVDTWSNEIVCLRESLLQIVKYWDEMGFGFPCPIHFTEEERRTHLEAADGWNNVQDFWDAISPVLDRDGWTHADTYDEAVELFKLMRNWGLENLEGKMREMFEKATRRADDL